MKFQKGTSLSLSLKKLTSKMQPLSLVWIAPGNFIMGSNGKKKEYRHGYEKPFKGTIAYGYWLGQYLITQNQWQVIMGNLPSGQSSCPKCPIDKVNREQAILFCNKLNELFTDQLPPSYEFSLPTEMQWEYACRAGAKEDFYYGDDILKLSSMAWYADNSKGRTHSVGTKDPNAWGLYDMIGNVWEWCYDFAAPYPDTSATDWIGDGDKSTGMFRGGNCRSSVESCDLYYSTRGYSWVDLMAPYLGFRLSLRMINH